MTNPSQVPLTPVRGFLVSLGVIAGVALSLLSLISGELVYAGLVAIVTAGGIHVLLADARSSELGPAGL